MRKLNNQQYLFIPLNQWESFAKDLIGDVSYTKKTASWETFKTKGSNSAHAIYKLLKLYCDVFSHQERLQNFISENISKE